MWVYGYKTFVGFWYLDNIIPCLEDLVLLNTLMKSLVSPISYIQVKLQKIFLFGPKSRMFEKFQISQSKFDQICP